MHVICRHAIARDGHIARRQSNRIGASERQWVSIRCFIQLLFDLWMYVRFCIHKYTANLFDACVSYELCILCKIQFIEKKKKQSHYLDASYTDTHKHEVTHTCTSTRTHTHTHAWLNEIWRRKPSTINKRKKQAERDRVAILHHLFHKQFLMEQCQSLLFCECQFKLHVHTYTNLIKCQQSHCTYRWILFFFFKNWT